MPRKNGYGNPIDSVISWLLARRVDDREMAGAIGIPPTTYSRRKLAEDFPSFEELQKLGTHFDISPRVLQIAFGHLGDDTVQLLDEAERFLYRKQGGDVPKRHDSPHFTHK